MPRLYVGDQGQSPLSYSYKSLCNVFLTQDRLRPSVLRFLGKLLHKNGILFKNVPLIQDLVLTKFNLVKFIT